MPPRKTKAVAADVEVDATATLDIKAEIEGEDSTESAPEDARMVYLSHREAYPLVLPMGAQTVKVPAGEEVAVDAEAFEALKHSHGVNALLVRGTLIARQAVV